MKCHLVLTLVCLVVLCEGNIIRLNETGGWWKFPGVDFGSRMKRDVNIVFMDANKEMEQADYMKGVRSGLHDLDGGLPLGPGAFIL